MAAISKPQEADGDAIGARAVEMRQVSDLVSFARNARTHSDAQVAQIAGSIREFGFNNPVLVDAKSGIIAGHGRVLAARKLGLDSVGLQVMLWQHVTLSGVFTGASFLRSYVLRRCFVWLAR